ncbi:MAG: NAD(P)-dependent alcohol dehydrogenase [Myxococcota bacterium]
MPTMRAAVMHEYGDAVAVEEIARPTPAAGQVLVRVRAASVNPVDWKQASGKVRFLFPMRFPGVPGYDVAGEVAEGEHAGLRVHARLLGRGGGAYAEYAVTDAWAPIPEGVEWGEAAGLPLAGMTALQGLRGVREGARVLVVGASGGVGHLAVQIARRMGAHVVGVCSGRNAALVGELGAHEVLDYTQPDPYRGQAPFDLVYDCVGSAPGDFLPMVSAAGTFASCMPRPSVFAWAARNPLCSQQVRAVMLKANAADLRALDAMGLRVVIDSRYPLARVGEAWARSKSGRVVGKVVIDVA